MHTFMFSMIAMLIIIAQIVSDRDAGVEGSRNGRAQGRSSPGMGMRSSNLQTSGGLAASGPGVRGSVSEYQVLVILMVAETIFTTAKQKTDNDDDEKQRFVGTQLPVMTIRPGFMAAMLDSPPIPYPLKKRKKLVYSEQAVGNLINSFGLYFTTWM